MPFSQYPFPGDKSFSQPANVCGLFSIGIKMLGKSQIFHKKALIMMLNGMNYDGVGRLCVNFQQSLTADFMIMRYFYRLGLPEISPPDISVTDPMIIRVIMRLYAYTRSRGT